MKNFSRRISLTLLTIFIFATTASAASTLIPGGQVIGLELRDDTVTVVAFDETLGDAAEAAGLKTGDRILRIDDTAVRCAEDVRSALACSDGQVDLSIQRGTKTKKLKLQPPLTDDGPRLGVYLRQGTTGLGTVTYYDPASGDFAALGHGVNAQNGELLQLHTGSFFEAQIASVKKGKVGEPGQLLGSLTALTPLGIIEKNTQQGVFGTADKALKGEALPVAAPEQVRTGSAFIRSTVSGTGVREYSVEILKIYPNAGNRNRNMLLKVTDPDLLAATGGIVQGMSGSPIIQDGKLVGAVTHVLVNDPTTGYGIFIENMLDAAA